MLEYPEIYTIVKQMNTVLPGKLIKLVKFTGLDRKFVFSNQSQAEFEEPLTGKTIDHIKACGNHLFIYSEEGPVLNIGDTGGKLLFHEPGVKLPKKYDLKVTFEDGSMLTHSAQMWGFLNAYTTVEEAEAHQQHILDEAREPFEARVTLEGFLDWLHEWEEAPKVNAKKFIISRKYITGLGNGYTQDILWKAKLHPRRKMNTVSDEEAAKLFHAIQDVVTDAVEHNGRSTERDLFNQPGNYEVMMGRKTLGTPCTVCGTEIIKFSFEGGACYICPTCQVDPRTAK